MRGHLALVLHAHLPYVRHPEHARALEERWFHEALWEAYLPLLAMLDRLAGEGVNVGLTLSVSPPLAAMLADPLLCVRFDAHLGHLDRLVERLLAGAGVPDEEAWRAGLTGPALPHYRAHVRAVRATWERIGGDVLGALVRHHRAGRIDLMTTTASHAYLPGLLSSPASIRAQLRLGLRAFERLTSVRPLGLWLPECAFDPRLAPDLAAAGVRFTVLDAHGIQLARPRPPLGITAPILSPEGVAFFARDPSSSRAVWSRQTGYPGDPWYRDFYRDVGFDLPEALLDGELGPHGTRLMTGVKLHRITGADEKAPYAPARAAERAREHARHFVEQRAAVLEARAGVEGGAPPLLVAPFDAELFGHWWFEGPLFLEHVLRALDASARAGLVASTTLAAHLDRFPGAFVAEPAVSSWGEGGFGEVWAGAATAHLWRHVHHAGKRVEQAVRERRNVDGVRGNALDQAVRELLLLQASDWAFMLDRGEAAEYADARVRAHAERATRLAVIACSEAEARDDAAWVRAVRDADAFLRELEGEELRDAFDAWGAPPRA